MSCLSLFNENRKILSVWTNVWTLLVSFALLLYGISVGMNTAWNAKSYELHKSPSFGALFGIIGFLALIIVTFWDLILYKIRVSSPLKRTYTSLIVEEKIDDVEKAKRISGWIIIVDWFLFLFSILLACYTPIAKHSELATATIKKISILKDVSDSHLRYGTWAFASTILLLFLVSFALKSFFNKTWERCLQIYPKRNLSYLIGDKPGITDLWSLHSTILLLLLPAIAALILAVWTLKKSLFSRFQITDFKAETWLYQAVMAILLLFLVVLISSFFSNSWKSKRVIERTLSRELPDRDSYEIWKVKNAIRVTTFIYVWLFFVWMLAVAVVILMTSELKLSFKDASYLKWSAIWICCLLSISSVSVFTVNSETIERFRRCNDFDYGRNLVLKFENIDF